MGDRLRAARTVAGITTREVAAATGRSKTAVEAWERHGYLPPPPARAVLAEMYRYPESVLFAEYAAHIDAALALLPARDDAPKTRKRTAVA